MKSAWKPWVIALVALAAAWLVWILLADDGPGSSGESGAHTSSGEGVQTTSSGDGRAAPSSAVRVDGASGRDGALQVNAPPGAALVDELGEALREGEEPTGEERAEVHRQNAIELNAGESPLECETHCDCPQGQTCQNGTQRCLPSPFRVWCCDRDGCPSGSQCVHMDGTYGVCDG